jgi:hypothetical protein
MGSYAGHMALNDYYEGVLDFIDTLIETYQGQYGLVEEYDVIDTKDTNSKDKIQYFKTTLLTYRTFKCLKIESEIKINNINKKPNKLGKSKKLDNSNSLKHSNNINTHASSLLKNALSIIQKTESNQITNNNVDISQIFLKTLHCNTVVN